MNTKLRQENQILQKSLALLETHKGKSVFTEGPIMKGEFIIEFKGHIYTKDQYQSIMDPENNHFLQVGENLYMGPSGSIDDYVNHSCNPNCGFLYSNSTRLYALRDIEAGEELTFDYSTTMDEEFWEMECCCGEFLCRNRIQDFKHLSEHLKRKYYKMKILPEFIVRKYFNV